MVKSTQDAIIDMSIRADYITTLYGEHSEQDDALDISMGKDAKGTPPSRAALQGLSAEEILCEVLKRRGWDERDGQLDMVDIIDSGENAVISAPVGIGKTLGYLIPGMLNSSQMMVATSTKALQDQIAEQEMPLLADDLEALYGFRPRWTIIKGMSNYLDYKRFTDWRKGTDPHDQWELGVTDSVIEAVEEEQARLNALTQDPNCYGYDSEAFAQNMPPRIWAIMCATDSSSHWVKHTHIKAYGYSEVIITNSAYATIILDQHSSETGKINGGLPQILVFDEAHHLQNIVTQAMSSTFDPEELYRKAKGLAEGYAKSLGSSVVKNIEILRDGLLESTRWVQDLKDDNEDSKQRSLIQMKLSKLSSMCISIVNSIDRIEVEANDKKLAVITVSPALSGTGKPRKITLPARNLSAALAVVETLEDMGIVTTTERIVQMDTRTGEPMFSYYFAMEDKSFDNSRKLCTDAFGLAPIYTDNFGASALCMASPFKIANTAQTNEQTVNPTINAARQLVANNICDNIEQAVEIAKSHINSFTSTRQVILASGTIAKKVTFALGLDDFTYDKMPSPFDPNNYRLFIPRHLPQPKHHEWQDEFNELCADMVKRSGGRAMILVSSYKTLDATYDYLSSQPTITSRFAILNQKNGSKKELISQFKEDETSILIGTKSFWEGVDIPGNALQMVIIDKIPFPAPTAIIKAREEYADRCGNGESPFKAVSILDASQMLAQGAGRLIRRETDKGTVVIADQRLVTSSYGRDVMALLPRGTKLTSKTEVIETWIAGVRQEAEKAIENQDQNAPHVTSHEPMRRSQEDTTTLSLVLPSRDKSRLSGIKAVAEIIENGDKEPPKPAKKKTTQKPKEEAQRPAPKRRPRPAAKVKKE